MIKDAVENIKLGMMSAIGGPSVVISGRPMVSPTMLLLNQINLGVTGRKVVKKTSNTNKKGGVIKNIMG